MLLPGNVELPGELDEALRSGRLVLFAGAGISVDPPSDLPLFEGLTREVLRLAGSTDEPDAKLGFDRQLGSLVDAQDFDVHGAVRNVLGRAGSSPNRWHTAIVSLFSDRGALRIVTTNYDPHLETAATDAYGAPPAVWTAPALPLGRTFRGIVHLHGSIDGPDEGLVVTDADFARAYLTEGWARRFLVDLFQHNVVLFVGYSHDDVVMQYLARGLPPGTSRFALIRAGDNDEEKWQRLGIIPVSWEDDGGGNPWEPGVEALTYWGRSAKKLPLEHREEIRRLVDAGPPVDPLDDDYLRAVITDPVQVRFFREEAQGDVWLEWVSKTDTFRGLCDRDAVANEAQAALAAWFAERCAFSFPDLAQHIVAQLGGKLSLSLWSALADTLWRNKPEDPKVFSSWVAILVDQVYGAACDKLLNYLATKCALPEDLNALAMLLQLLVRPQIRLRPGIELDGQTTPIHPEIVLRGDPYWLAELRDNVIAPALDEVAGVIYSITVGALCDAHRMLAALGQATETHDSISFLRSAIEPHEQDRRESAMGVLIDLARDAARARASRTGTWAVVNDLLRRRVPILTRLAIWLVDNATDVDPEAKLVWCLDRGLLSEALFRHEVFKLLEGAFPGAPEELRTRVWEAGSEPEIEDPDTRAYEAYNFAVWVNRIDPGFGPAREHLEAACREHPEWQPRDHPDLIAWTGPVKSGWAEVAGSPIQDLTQLSFEELRERELAQGSEPWAFRFREHVAAAVSDSPEWGLSVLEGLSQEGDWESELWTGVAAGLTQGTLSEEQWRRLLELYRNHGRPGIALDGLSNLLLEAVKSDPPALATDLLAVAAETLNDLIMVFSRTAEDLPPVGHDVVFKSLNSWPGRVAKFFVKAVGLHEKSGGDPCGTPGLETFVVSITEHRSSVWARLAAAILGGALPYLLLRCPQLTQDNLVPLFDWERPDMAQAAWSGLAYVAWTRATVDALYHRLGETAERIDRFEPQAQHGLVSRLAQVAVDYDADPLADDGWLRRFVSTASETIRSDFAHAVARVLEHRDGPAREAAWERWLEAYWRQRVEGFPRQISPQEGSAMLTWVPLFPDHLPDLVELVAAMPLAPRETFGLFRSLRDASLPGKQPDSVLRLLSDVLSKKDRVFDRDTVREIVEQARNAGASAEAMTDVCNELARLGFVGLDGLCPGTD